MSKGFNNKKYDYENELQFRQNLPPDPPYVVEGIEKISTMNTLLLVYQSEIISSSIIFLADMYAEILLTMKEMRHIFGQQLSNKGCITKFQLGSELWETSFVRRHITGIDLNLIFLEKKVGRQNFVCSRTCRSTTDKKLSS